MSGNSEGAAERDSAEQNPESGQPQQAQAQQAQSQQAQVQPSPQTGSQPVQQAQGAQAQQAAYADQSGGPTHFPQGFDAGQSGQGPSVGGAPHAQPQGAAPGAPGAPAAPGAPSLEGASMSFPGGNRAAGDFFKKRSSLDILAAALIVISFFAPWGDKSPLLLLAFVAAIAGASSSWWAHLVNLHPVQNALLRLGLLTPMVLFVAGNAIMIGMKPQTWMLKAWGPGCVVAMVGVALAVANIRGLPERIVRLVGLVTCGVVIACFLSAVFRGLHYEAIKTNAEFLKNLERQGESSALVGMFFLIAVLSLTLPVLVALGWKTDKPIFSGVALGSAVTCVICVFVSSGVEKGLDVSSDSELANFVKHARVEFASLGFSMAGTPVLACLLFVGILLVAPDRLAKLARNQGVHGVFYSVVAGISLMGAVTIGLFGASIFKAAVDSAIAQSNGTVGMVIPWPVVLFAGGSVAVSAALFVAMRMCLTAAGSGQPVGEKFWHAGWAGFALVVVFMVIFHSLNTDASKAAEKLGELLVNTESQDVAQIKKLALEVAGAKIAKIIQESMNIPAYLIFTLLPMAVMKFVRPMVLGSPQPAGVAGSVAQAGVAQPGMVHPGATSGGMGQPGVAQPGNPPSNVAQPGVAPGGQTSGGQAQGGNAQTGNSQGGNPPQ